MPSHFCSQSTPCHSTIAHCVLHVIPLSLTVYSMPSYYCSPCTPCHHTIAHCVLHAIPLFSSCTPCHPIVAHNVFYTIPLPLTMHCVPSNSISMCAPCHSTVACSVLLYRTSHFCTPCTPCYPIVAHYEPYAIPLSVTVYSMPPLSLTLYPMPSNGR
jgi:hypothetical protein